MLQTAPSLEEHAQERTHHHAGRAWGRPFQPGVCPNPTGRPKKTEDERKAEAIAKERSAWAMRRLVRLIENPKTSEVGCLRAIELLLAYGLGKPGLREGPDLEGLQIVVQALNVNGAPVAGVIASPVLEHVQALKLVAGPSQAHVAEAFE